MMIELSSLKEREINENRGTKGSRGAASSAKGSPRHTENIAVLPNIMTESIMSSLSSSETHCDEVSGKYYVLDKETGERTWLEERLDFNIARMDSLQMVTIRESMSDVVEVVIDGAEYKNPEN